MIPRESALVHALRKLAGGGGDPKDSDAELLERFALARDERAFAALMDLRSVDLAVLSACETGLGKLEAGEGVLGLQRALQVSGTGTVVATLWQIPDEPTRFLMERFYANLWDKKLPKLEALREAQVWMLREGKRHEGLSRGLESVGDNEPKNQAGRLPPYYWAAFVLSGDWR